MASVIYNSFKKELMDGSIDLDTDTFYVMLVSNTYTPNIDSHTRRADVTSYEVSGTGYVAGGAKITGLTVTQDNSGDAGVWDGADVAWNSSTITARGAIIYKSTGNAANDNLVCYFDFGSDQSSSNGTFALAWSSSGIMKLT